MTENIFRIINEKTINCANCKKELLDIVKVGDSTRKNYYIAKCPYCGDKSYKCLVTGIVYCLPHEGLVIKNIVTDTPIENTFVNNMELIKR